MKDAEQGRYEIGIDHRDSMKVEGRSFTERTVGSKPCQAFRNHREPPKGSSQVV